MADINDYEFTGMKRMWNYIAKICDSWEFMQVLLFFLAVWLVIQLGISGAMSKNAGGGLAKINFGTDEEPSYLYQSWTTKVCDAQPYVFMRPFNFKIPHTEDSTVCGSSRNVSDFRFSILVIGFFTVGTLSFHTPLSFAARQIFMIFGLLFFAAGVLDSNSALKGLANCNNLFHETQLYTDLHSVGIKSVHCSGKFVSALCWVDFLISAQFFVLHTVWLFCKEKYVKKQRKVTDIILESKFVSELPVVNAIDNFVDVCNYAIALSNRNFLTEYGSYVDPDWKSKYICYDLLQLRYKDLKDLESSQSRKHSPRRHQGSLATTLVYFEMKFRSEIQKVFEFLSTQIKRVDVELDQIDQEYETLNEDQKKELLRKNENTKSSYRKIRRLYTTIDRLNAYFLLNEFAINKMGKKFDKILSKLPHNFESEIEAADTQQPINKLTPHTPSDTGDTVTKLSWDCFNSYSEFSLGCPEWAHHYDASSAKCVRVYTKIFRQTHEHIAAGELRFFKSKEGVSRQTPYLIGFKLGFVASMSLWLLVDALVLNGHFYYWTTPGLFVFSFIGGILIFKVMWVIGVWIWSVYNVNYIELFGTADADAVENRPSTVNIMNHTMDLLIVFIGCLIFFYRINSLQYKVATFWEYISPFGLFIAFVLYIVYNLGPKRFHVLGMEYPSTNLFGWKVLRRCLVAPYYKVSFIDNVAADALTSFTRIISDSLHAVCWIVSGSFTRPVIPPNDGSDFDPQTTDNYGSESLSCTGDSMRLLVGFCMVIPLWIRFLQCMRGFYDNSSIQNRVFPVFPHILNAIKYLLSMAVVLYGLFLFELNSFYYFLIVFTTLYKWLWDVIVDWGCFYSLLQKGLIGLLQTPISEVLFLRPNLMYEKKIYYIFAIIIDLILRFVWVVSLAPASLTSGFAKSALQMFMGALEIIRRGMWSIFRVEHEHVNKLHGNALGVLLEKKSVQLSHTTHVIAQARLRSASAQSLQSLELQYLTDNGLEATHGSGNIENNEQSDVFTMNMDEGWNQSEYEEEEQPLNF